MNTATEPMYGLPYTKRYFARTQHDTTSLLCQHIIAHAIKNKAPSGIEFGASINDC
jgi:hypothetical protein